MAYITINEQGTKQYYNHFGQYHREDGPAVIYADCSFIWYKNDHRDGPSTGSRGDYYWWIEGSVSRINGPAWDHPNGFKKWLRGSELVWPEL